MDLEKELIEFYNITLELMDRIKIQGNRLYLLKRREEILDNIKQSNFDSNELKAIGIRLKIDELEKELHKRILEEMSNIKREIHQLKRREQGNQQYISASYGGYNMGGFDKRY